MPPLRGHCQEPTSQTEHTEGPQRLPVTALFFPQVTMGIHGCAISRLQGSWEPPKGRAHTLLPFPCGTAE